MGRKKEIDPFTADATANETPVAVIDNPQPADPQPNGEQPHPQPATTPRRKKRDPNAPRPWYQIQGVDRYTGAIRIIMGASTVGQARKKLADAVQASGGNVESVQVVRCKAVV